MIEMTVACKLGNWIKGETDFSYRMEDDYMEQELGKSLRDHQHHMVN